MENNIRNLYFSTHLGSEVIFNEDASEMTIVLNSIDKITDEHVLEICVMCNLNYLMLCDANIAYIKSFIVNSIHMNVNINGIIEAIDYLRYRGYAMPFMGLSVQQLLDYGWLKIRI